ncbi:hypothetical protein ZHAS_00002436 [Anopheles sinensis]|uniref:Uncharacterized protein n=1 Tax=Anopheles sinensis TaxID=74873 RepID=A0A084VC82_ANOSI|nr:hypothetical protein ZHAS_00002436 [Anopheles sinensis]
MDRSGGLNGKDILGTESSDAAAMRSGGSGTERQRGYRSLFSHACLRTVRYYVDFQTPTVQTRQTKTNRFAVPSVAT